MHLYVLILLCVFQIVTIQRQVFDFLGYMWLPIIANFVNIILIIFGSFGAVQYVTNYLLAVSKYISNSLVCLVSWSYDLLEITNTYHTISDLVLYPLKNSKSCLFKKINPQSINKTSILICFFLFVLWYYITIPWPKYHKLVMFNFHCPLKWYKITNDVLFNFFTQSAVFF